METIKTNIKYIILDDVELTRNMLIRVISMLRPDFTLAGVAEEVSESENLFSTCNPDLIFSKLYLSDSSVIQVLSQNCPDCPVVLISEYEKHRVNPTGIRLIDYLLEPVTYEDIGKALDNFDRLSITHANPMHAYVEYSENNR